MRDPYGALGLSQSASLDEVKKAFRKLALEHHPDRHATASESTRAASSNRFKLITEAYEILSDDTKRDGLRYQQPQSSSSTSSSYSSHHYYDRDAAFRQKYAYTPNRPPKMNLWQNLQRMLGAKGVGRFELTLAVAGTTFLFLGLGSVEHLWRLRNADKLKRGWDDPVLKDFKK